MRTVPVDKAARESSKGGEPGEAEVTSAVITPLVPTRMLGGTMRSCTYGARDEGCMEG